MNMMSLYFLGRFIEYALGSWRMLLVYMVSLVASGLGVVYFSAPNVPTVGASGAIFGLFGALFAIGFKLGKPGMDLVRANIGILVLNLIITFTVPAISWQAHVAGLARRIRADLRGLFSAAPRRAGRRRREDGARARVGVRDARRPARPAAVTATLEHVFGPDGPIAQTLSGFEARPGQVQMAQLVERGILEGMHTIVEAGTGVGKSLAYLVPAMRSGKKVVLSTGTIALQEQLVHKDIPLVEAALGIAGARRAAQRPQPLPLPAEIRADARGAAGRAVALDGALWEWAIAHRDRRPRRASLPAARRRMGAARCGRRRVRRRVLPALPRLFLL